MEESGYTLDKREKCRSCGAEIDFYWTPNGKRAPMNAMDGADSPAISHFATCPDADRFRRHQ
jgi:hypothetical protein